MGPTIIFDKSFIESINPDEAVWLEQFFNTNLIPLLYIETLADLAKTPKPKRSPEKLVHDLANKIPQQTLFLNVYAGELVSSELLGYKVKMEGKPIVSNIRSGATEQGETISHIEETSEERAFNRWQEGDFKEIEKLFSSRWRTSLPNIIKEEYIDLVRNIIPKGKSLKTYKEIFLFISEFLESEDSHILYLVQELLHIPNEVIKIAEQRWVQRNAKTIFDIAPYTGYVLNVELLFYLSIINGLLSREKISNRTDTLYLHYLPFTDIFVSGDKLHQDIVPLFLTKDQLFIFGPDLKKALTELDLYFDAFPEGTKAKGVINFARLPKDSNNLVCQIWTKFFPDWKEKDDSAHLSEEEEKELVAKIKALREKSLEGNNALEDTDHVIRAMKIKQKKGRWNMLPSQFNKN